MSSNGGAETVVETLNLEEVTGCISWTRGGGELSYVWLELAALQIYDFLHCTIMRNVRKDKYFPFSNILLYFHLTL